MIHLNVGITFQSFGSYELISFFLGKCQRLSKQVETHSSNFSFPHSCGHGKWSCSEMINLSLRLRACLQSQSQEEKRRSFFDALYAKEIEENVCTRLFFSRSKRVLRSQASAKKRIPQPCVMTKKELVVKKIRMTRLCLRLKNTSIIGEP